MAVISGTKSINQGNALGDALAFIEKKHIQFPFQRSQVGGSGLTYLPLDRTFPWVIKWQNRHQAEIEYLCTQFYQRTVITISVPSTELSDTPSSWKALHNYFDRNVSIASTHVPLMIAYKDGNNFYALCRNGKLFTLTQPDLEQLFFLFGNLSGHDFLIGNCDRFFPAGFRGVIEKDYGANGGNILVELEVHESDTSTPRLRFVHAIDNAPHFNNFFTIDEMRIRDNSPNLDLTTFWDDTDRKEIGEIVREVSPRPLVTGEPKRKERHEDFVFFMTASGEQMEQLSRQIVIGLKNAAKKAISLHDAELDEFFQKDFIEKAVYAGLISARQQMTNPELSKSLGEIQSTSSDYLDTAKTVFDFIRKNLTFAKDLTLS